MRQIRIGLAQINTIVGDIEGNTSKIIETMQRAKRSDVDVLAFPEMTISGYPPEDLLFKPEFIEDNLKALKRCAGEAQDILAIVGFVNRADDLYNAAGVLAEGKIAGIYHKTHLPNYGVFDENRYFKKGLDNKIVRAGDIKIGITVCEDIWYPAGPALTQAQAGACLIINVNASPYHAGKPIFRERMLAVRAYDATAFMAYVNLVGGQDELVFDGGSLIIDPSGRVLSRGALFKEDLVIADIDLDEVLRARLNDPRRRKEWLNGEPLQEIEVPAIAAKEKAPIGLHFVEPLIRKEEIYAALTLGLQDYVSKNGFTKVVIGLSGGIDSSLTAVLAVDALGREHVVGVKMPSKFTSKESDEDAEELAGNLGIELLEIPIEPAHKAFAGMLEEAFSDTEPGAAEENIQARIRGNILMALSNKYGWLVLTTGNKSETAVGYSTLYGDMAGGFSLLKDIPKTLVYRLAEYRNKRTEQTLMPERVFTKAPTAELRAGQKDTDALPPYDVLDPILEAYVERDLSAEEIIALGFKANVVEDVIRRVDSNEYKRRQSPPGIKITPRAFGKDRRLPITNLYKTTPQEEATKKNHK